MKILRDARVHIAVLVGTLVIVAVACNAPASASPTNPTLDVDEGFIEVVDDPQRGVTCYVWDGQDQAGGISCVALP